MRNFDSRHGRIESGAVVKNRKGINRRCICYQWKEKVQYSQGDRCSFITKPKIAHKNPNTLAPQPSEPTVSRGRSVSRKKSFRGKSNRGSILRQPCRNYVKGTCTRTSCEYWHPPECQFLRKNETGCKAGDNCLFPHYKVDEQPNAKAERKRTTSQKKRKRRQNAVVTVKVYHNWVVYHKIQMHSFLKVGSLGEPEAESLGTNSKGTIHQVYTMSSEYPGKERTIVGRDKMSKLLISEDPYAIKF